jgi:hypothetical protein
MKCGKKLEKGSLSRKKTESKYITVLQKLFGMMLGLCVCVHYLVINIRTQPGMVTDAVNPATGRQR